MKHSVETSGLAINFGAKNLDKALSKLLTSNTARTALINSVGEDDARHILAMVDSGRLKGKVGKIIRDFFRSEIINSSKTVWYARISRPKKQDINNRLYMGINEYEGVFFAWDREFGNKGYFLSANEAEKYLDYNWGRYEIGTCGVWPNAYFEEDSDPWEAYYFEQAIPAEALHLCSYEYFMIVQEFEVSVYLHRTGDTDELWISEDYAHHKEPLFTVPRKNSVHSAGKRLFDLYIRGSVGHRWPSRFIDAGIINEDAFDNIVGNIKEELDQNVKSAEKNETEIIKVARELKLNPTPTGTGPAHWRANCPGTGHHLLIQAETNSFGCGYCKRKGNSDELQTFVALRKTSTDNKL